jgi:hypothetical protein
MPIRADIITFQSLDVFMGHLGCEVLISGGNNMNYFIGIQKMIGEEQVSRKRRCVEWSPRFF